MDQLDNSEIAIEKSENGPKPLPSSSGTSLIGIGKGNNPNSIAALTHFKPGQSGNPSGRPKKVANALDKALNRKKLKAMANGIIDQAIKGDVAAFKEVADRVDGPVARPITGENGGPMQIEIVTRLIGSREPK